MREELEDLKQALDKAADSTARQVAIAKLNQNMIKDLESDISTFKGESMKQRKMLYTLEKEREKYGCGCDCTTAAAIVVYLLMHPRLLSVRRFGAEASDANAKFAAALEEVKLREMAILDLQKKVRDSQLAQQPAFASSC